MGEDLINPNINTHHTLHELVVVVGGGGSYYYTNGIFWCVSHRHNYL